MSYFPAVSHQNAASAQIIAFPRNRPAAITHIEATPAQQLARALVMLDEALAAQRQAVAGWRGAIADLGGGVSALGHSIRGLHDALDNLDGRPPGSPNS